MELIETNQKLYNLLKNEIHIISATITSFYVYVLNGILTIDIDIILLHDKGKHLKLRFTDIKEYAFNYTDRHHFYYIEDFKLLLKEDLFYISLDPDLKLPDYSPTDNDIVLCGSIEGYYV